MAKDPLKERLEACTLAMRADEDVTNPFIDMSDETALVAAGHLIEIAAFNLSARLSAEAIAGLVDISIRLSEYVDGLGDGDLPTLARYQRPH